MAYFFGRLVRLMRNAVWQQALLSCCETWYNNFASEFDRYSLALW